MKLQTLKYIRSASDEALVTLLLTIATTNRAIVENAVEVAINGEGIKVPTLGYLPAFTLPRAKLNGVDNVGKVTGIKQLREVFGIGLKEAKDLSEWLQANGHIHYSENF